MDPVTYQSSEFGFSRKQISRAALQVVEGLQRAGFDGYLVGGCVRDLVLNKDPKDFDVTTNASPEEVKKLFQRARIIGRRFRIVHVRFGYEVIEVATYRANPGKQGLIAKKHKHKKSWFGFGRKKKPATSAPSSGRILDDNVYGTIEDDAVRRDFTVNALYYDPTSEEVIDFLGGVEDMDDNCIKMIGDPAARFAEDPVRMLRVVRFKAKLGLEPEKALTAAVLKHHGLISDVPPARLYDEVLKMFHHAHGVNSWYELCDSGLADYLFPQTMEAIAEPEGERWEQLILQALENTDRRISQGKPVIPAFLYAVLLWRPFCVLFEELSVGKKNLNEIFWRAGEQIFGRQNNQVSIPRRASAPAIEVWNMQRALERRQPKSILSLLQNRRFRAAYDFMILRSEIGEVDRALVDWWTRIQDVSEGEQDQMIDALRANGSRHHSKKGGERRSNKRQPDNEAQQSENAQASDKKTGKKKRRRRRRSGQNNTQGNNTNNPQGHQSKDGGGV